MDKEFKRAVVTGLVAMLNELTGSDDDGANIVPSKINEDNEQESTDNGQEATDNEQETEASVQEAPAVFRGFGSFRHKG